VQEAQQRADAVYELVVGRHARAWSRPLRVFSAVALAVLQLGTVGPSVGDYVVRRRSDGHEVLRLGGDGDGFLDTLDHLRTQLATMTPAEFRAAWGIPA
jgi:hypothetical protein